MSEVSHVGVARATLGVVVTNWAAERKTGPSLDIQMRVTIGDGIQVKSRGNRGPV